jgi:hypothetical protein
LGCQKSEKVTFVYVNNLTEFIDAEQ